MHHAGALAGELCTFCTQPEAIFQENLEHLDQPCRAAGAECPHTYACGLQGLKPSKWSGEFSNCITTRSHEH